MELLILLILCLFGLERLILMCSAQADNILVGLGWLVMVGLAAVAVAYQAVRVWGG